MTNDLVPYQPTQNPNGWVELMKPAADLARTVANTEFVPKALRGSPEKVAACVLFGSELGIGPMQALAKIDIVEGKPAPNAELGRALVLAAGHDFEVVESTNTKVTVRGRRRGSDTWQTASYSMDDARQAGLAQKDNYRKHPRRMLLARASAELCHASFADCLGGIAFFAEEADDDRTQDTAPIVAEVAPKKSARRLAPVAPVVAASDELPPLPDELEPAAGADPISDQQMKKMLALMTKLHVTERDDRLGLTADIVGHPVTTAKELTKAEASAVIDRLVAVDEERAEIVLDDGIPTIIDKAGAA